MEIRPATADPVDISLVTLMRLEFLADAEGIGADELPQALVEATHAFVAEQATSGVLRTWLAHDKDDCAGVVSVVLQHTPPRAQNLRTHEGYIINMYVVPRHRSAGLGRRLLDTVFAAGPAMGVRKWLLFATDAGRPLYESAGFTANPAWMELRAPD